MANILARTISLLLVSLQIRSLLVMPSFAVSIPIPLFPAGERAVAGGIRVERSIFNSQTLAAPMMLEAINPLVDGKAKVEISASISQAAAQVPKIEFILDVDPCSFFSMMSVQNTLRERGIPGKLRARLEKSHRWNLIEIKLNLLHDGHVTSLIQVQVEALDRIHYDIFWPPKELPPKLKAALWTHQSDRKGDSQGATFFNLKPMAQIIQIETARSRNLRFLSLVPPIWVRFYLEPYLRRCGFAALTLLVPCVDNNPRLRALWKRAAGFSEFVQISHTGGDDQIQRYISFKALTPAA